MTDKQRIKSLPNLELGRPKPKPCKWNGKEYNSQLKLETKTGGSKGSVNQAIRFGQKYKGHYIESIV